MEPKQKGKRKGRTEEKKKPKQTKEKRKKEKEETRPCTNLETSGMCINLGQRPSSVAKIRQQKCMTSRCGLDKDGTTINGSNQF